MQLIDHVLNAGAESIECEVNIRADSMFCDGRSVGAWVGLEYMAQAVAAFAGTEAKRAGRPVRVGFLLGTRRYECSVPSFVVGSRLIVRARRELQGENGLGSFECSISGDGVDAHALVTVFQPPAEAAR
jgi:predicted hotdog family 3-hydroxylacyl-ACP dehydratase